MSVGCRAKPADRFYYKIDGKSMAKRELLIAAAFVALAVVAYQLTAPLPTPAPGRFSLTQLISSWRREIRGNSGRASFVHRDAIPAPPAVTELRLAAITSLTVVGERRPDIVYELTVQSTGADHAAALASAEATKVTRDEFGGILALRLQHPPDARSTTTMTIRVPARLAVRVEGIRHTAISEVGAVYLEAVVGDVQVSAIGGAVSGSHRNGTLVVTGAGSVNLSLTSSRASFVDIRGSVSLTARNGEAHLAGPRGGVDVSVTDLDLVIAHPRGPVRIGGVNGQVTVDRPQGETRIDGRRTDVTVTLAAAVPITVVTTDRPLRLLLDGPPPVTIDATATEGAAIDASEFGLAADRSERDQRLTHAFGDGARVALRTQRGAIVIGRSK